MNYGFIANETVTTQEIVRLLRESAAQSIISSWGSISADAPEFIRERLRAKWAKDSAD